MHDPGLRTPAAAQLSWAPRRSAFVGGRGVVAALAAVPGDEHRPRGRADGHREGPGPAGAVIALDPQPGAGDGVVGDRGPTPAVKLAAWPPPVTYTVPPPGATATWKASSVKLAVPL